MNYWIKKKMKEKNMYEDYKLRIKYYNSLMYKVLKWFFIENPIDIFIICYIPYQVLLYILNPPPTLGTKIILIMIYGWIDLFVFIIFRNRLRKMRAFCGWYISCIWYNRKVSIEISKQNIDWVLRDKYAASLDMSLAFLKHGVEHHLN